MKPTLIMAVAVGGAVGAVGRYAIAHLAQQQLATSFPVGTLVANVVGCLMIGFCFVWFDQRIGSPELRLGVQVGLIGALTTFSTYALESLNLAADRQYGLMALNLFGSLLLGLAAAYAGLVIGRALFGAA